MKKKYPIILLIVIILLVVFVLIFKHNQLKIDLYKLIKSKEYESVTLNGIYITDSDKLLIDFYIEDEKESISDTFKIRSIVKDYLKKHDEYKNMCVEICFQSYSQSFSITFANYDEYRTNINFKNSYDMNFGWFNCDFMISLSDFEGVEGIEDFEILGFCELYDYHDASVLDTAKSLKFLYFNNSKVITDYDYLVKKHPNCKIEIYDSEHLEK